MATQPTGTVTFLFTDIEGSTKLWETYPDAMPAAIKRHDDLLRQAVEAQGGYVFKTVGDAICAAFATAPEALQAALNAQRALRDEPWGDTVIKVRMALHTGATEERDGDYFGPPVNRVARLLSAGHGGQILLSSATQELVRDQLPEQVTLRDMGEHRLKDLIRPEHVFQILTPDLPPDFPALKTLDIHPNNLPAQTTTFIGRESECAAVEAIFVRPDVRLLTLTGPGGTGKTRLSLQVAADVLENFADGVFFVPLAPLSDPAFVIPTVIQVLGLQASGSTPPLDVLKNYLHDKQMLLLLDNFEQVLDAAPAITDILTAAPHVNILVTSRTVLRLSGEHNYPVPALDLPDPKRELTVRKLSQYEAVRLFIERACAAKPDFAITNANAPAVAEICVRLDGLPLAIELAAARVRLLPPHKMLPQLEHRLKFLTGGGRDVPARQQALRNTIEWSYQLLTDEEKTLFRRLAVFVGGCSLEAIEAVCAGGQELDIFSGVESLADKSLLKQVEMDAEPRFVMLETIREYALERLAESGEGETIRRRHAQYFLELAEAAEPRMYSVEQLDLLNRDIDNFRSVLAWSLDNAIEIGLHLTAALGQFWLDHTYYDEGQDWLMKALAHCPACAPELDKYRARILCHAGTVAMLQGNFTVASGFLHESEALCYTLNDTAGLARVFRDLGMCAQYSTQDLAGSRLLFEKSLALCRQINDTPQLVRTLLRHGDVAHAQGDDEQVEASAKESITLAQKINDHPAVAYGIRLLGQVASDRNDYETARALYEKSLELFQKMADKAEIGFSIIYLALLFHAHEQYEQAATCYADTLKIFQEINVEWVPAPLEGLGYVSLRRQHWQEASLYFAKSLMLCREREGFRGIASPLTGFAGVAEGQGRLERAAQFLGVVETTQGSLVKVFKREYERIYASVCSALGDEAFAAAIATGRALTLEQAVALALEGQPAG